VERQSGEPGELDDLVRAFGDIRKLNHGAERKDERKQNHARRDQLDQVARRRGVMVRVVVPMIVAVVVRVIMMVVMAVIVRVAVPVVVVNVLYAFSDRHCGGRLRIQQLAEEQHQTRSAERKQWDQPDKI
jgi:hypothetical protein